MMVDARGAQTTAKQAQKSPIPQTPQRNILGMIALKAGCNGIVSKGNHRRKRTYSDKIVSGV